MANIDHDVPGVNNCSHHHTILLLENIYYKQIILYLQEESYILSDVVFCDKDTYTFYSDAQLSTSWIDHYMTTRSFHTLIHSAKVHYEMISSDHFPLGMKLEVKVPHSVPKTCDNTKVRRVKWSDLSEAQRETEPID